MARLNIEQKKRRKEFKALFYEILPCVDTQKEAYNRTEKFLMKKYSCGRFYANYKSFHRSLMNSYYMGD